MSYLSDKEIEQAIGEGQLRFDPPLSPDQFSACSIDLRIGESIQIPPDTAPGFEMKVKTIKARPQDSFPTISINTPYDLRPHEFVLGKTFERIVIAGDAALVGFIEGRSGVARHGLVVHCTAPMVQPGWAGQITLELVNHGKYPIALHTKDSICQMMFARLGTLTTRPYSSQQQQQPGFGNGLTRTAPDGHASRS